MDGTRTLKRDDDCSCQHTIRSTNANVHALPLPCPCSASWEFCHSIDCGAFNTLIINEEGDCASGRWTKMSAPLSPSPRSRRCALLSPPHAARRQGSRQRPSGCPWTISRSLQRRRLRLLPPLLHSFSSIVFAPPPASSSCSSSSMPPKSQLHLQSVRVMAVAAVAGGGSGGYAQPPLPQTHLFNRLGG
jgi:hypothetical protein